MTHHLVEAFQRGASIGRSVVWSDRDYPAPDILMMVRYPSADGVAITTPPNSVTALDFMPGTVYSLN
jgi:hypothetical protein